MGKRRLVRAAAVLFVAFLVGHLMQFGLGSATGAGSSESKPPPQTPHMPPDPRNAQIGRPAGVHLASLSPDTLGAQALRKGPADVVIRRPVPSDPFSRRAPVEQDRLSRYGLPCTLSLDLTPGTGGMLRVAIAAPCQPGARVEVAHEGLHVAIRTTDVGLAEMALPVFAEQATVEIRLPDGQTATSTALVRDAPDHARVALAWSGQAAMSIHAFEFGAGYGAPGHVHRGAAVAAGKDGSRGQLILLGDPGLENPLLAEVYTFPIGIVPGQGAVRLHIEAEVTSATCGREIVGETFQKTPLGPASATRLRLEMPGCEATGDILVLKNVLRDLRIASN